MATVGLAASVTDRILSLPGWLVLALVFAFPALEASAFVGFVFPGEVAVILGGVAASRGTVPLWAVIAAARSGGRDRGLGRLPDRPPLGRAAAGRDDRSAAGHPSAPAQASGVRARLRARRLRP